MQQEKNHQQFFAGARLKHHAMQQTREAHYPQSLLRYFSLAVTASAVREISAWHGYQPTELFSLQSIATEFGLGTIHYKDESSRFGLGSFKALGGAYAVLSLLQQQIFAQCGKHVSARELEHGKFSELTASVTVVTATDGNHGRSVAWGAGRFGCRCRIYIHAAVSTRRASAMQKLGAEVIRIQGNYDESVRVAARDAAQNHWHVVSDTSYSDYTELPATIMAGYSVFMHEVMQQLPREMQLTHVFVQGGVGGLAAAVAAYLWEKLAAQRPRFIVVEPELADCLFQSACNQRATEVRITKETIMAGLSCGEVSSLAWQVLSLATDDFITITDELVAPCMRMLAHGKFFSSARPNANQNTDTQTSQNNKTNGAVGIEAGESAVAGLAACLAACANPQLKAALGLNERSQVLILGTEGATDREIYQQLVSNR